MGFLFQVAICSCRSETTAGMLLAAPGHVFFAVNESCLFVIGQKCVHVIDFSNAISLCGNHFKLCVFIEIDADSIEAS